MAPPALGLESRGVTEELGAREGPSLVAAGVPAVLELRLVARADRGLKTAVVAVVGATEAAVVEVDSAAALEAALVNRAVHSRPPVMAGLPEARLAGMAQSPSYLGAAPKGVPLLFPSHTT